MYTKDRYNRQQLDMAGVIYICSEANLAGEGYIYAWKANILMGEKHAYMARLFKNRTHYAYNLDLNHRLYT